MDDSELPEQAPARDTVLVAAFEGWNDAGGAATAAVLHLVEQLSATKVADIDPEEFYDFQVNRPVVATEEDGSRSLTWPTTTVAVVTLGDRRLVLVHATEPSMRWRTYCTELLRIADGLDVGTVVTLGGLLADVPHTRPIPVTATSDDPTTRALLDLPSSEYEGPTGIVGVLQSAARAHGLRSFSVWAAVPHYVAHGPSPKATLAILSRLEELLGLTVPLGDLVDDARAWEDGVDVLAREDEEIAEYVGQLEAAKDAVDLPEASGDAIAREFERYLRRREDGKGDGPGRPDGPAA
ncbi:PAC2 family protein [Sanguibacter sp. HDW7]|uniref:PAC2 family protein n=1 Tax=Sanguibacter sp. HDW7 TaxID=2714931 RepID=UPI001409D0C3|nr:PAC2 family protein [Sanguibacter sp. HDW7]QIK83424.1 PAC2 family protein [Sanguibacter sp. HDW7]